MIRDKIKEIGENVDKFEYSEVYKNPEELPFYLKTLVGYKYKDLLYVEIRSPAIKNEDNILLIISNQRFNHLSSEEEELLYGVFLDRHLKEFEEKYKFNEKKNKEIKKENELLNSINFN